MLCVLHVRVRLCRSRLRVRIRFPGWGAVLDIYRYGFLSVIKRSARLIKKW